MRQEGRGMLAPEDEDTRAGKGNEALLPTVEGIAPTAEARPQPGHEPLPVEGRDVRSPAGGDDEGGVGEEGHGTEPRRKGVREGLLLFIL